MTGRAVAASDAGLAAAGVGLGGRCGSSHVGIVTCRLPSYCRRFTALIHVFESAHTHMRIECWQISGKAEFEALKETVKTVQGADRI